MDVSSALLSVNTSIIKLISVASTHCIRFRQRIRNVAIRGWKMKTILMRCAVFYITAIREVRTSFTHASY